MVVGCVECIWATLAQELNEEDACFDDLVMYCVERCSGKVGPGVGVAEWVAAHDRDRTEAEVALDLVAYARSCGCKRSLEVLVEQAVLMGKTGWEEGRVDED